MCAHIFHCLANNISIKSGNTGWHSWCFKIRFWQIIFLCQANMLTAGLVLFSEGLSLCSWWIRGQVRVGRLCTSLMICQLILMWKVLLVHWYSSFSHIAHISNNLTGTSNFKPEPLQRYCSICFTSPSGGSVLFPWQSLFRNYIYFG